MASDSPPARERFLVLLRGAVADGTLTKLTLGKYRGADSSLRNLSIRPVSLRAGPRLSFVWRHATRDVTKNHPRDEALAEIASLVGGDFLHAHLFACSLSAQLECETDGSARLKIEPGVAPAKAEQPAATPAHDQAKHYVIPADSPWLRSLGVTNDQGRPREGMAPKFRQIQKFAELLSHLIGESGLDAAPLQVVDMGCGKGYLTFAVSALLGDRAQVTGIEARAELVNLANRVAAEQGLAAHLAFTAGNIADTALAKVDLLIALHACDTATDDALAKGIAAGARLLVVSPCCQKELRPQLTAPAVLADALRHGILQERQAEFVTDALRAQLLEWAGYRTRVFEFVSTEHTAKNLMIVAIKGASAHDPALAARVRAFAAFYGIRAQSLARQLEFDLSGQ
jgi:protein-L-isoaspartate O-methyltransferase